MYNQQWLASKEFDLPVIVVGNLSVGGTGKTPHSEWIATILLQQLDSVALLSRGYKRKSKGYIKADHNSTVGLLGDEPFMIHRKLPKLTVAVCENRVEGIERLRNEDSFLSAIILDDAFQHRAVKAGFNIVLTDYYSPFYEDQLLPVGRLREPSSSVVRADVIIVTRCPEKLSVYDKRYVIDRVKVHAHQLVIFSRLSYKSIVWMFPEKRTNPISKTTRILLITGIANPEALLKQVKFIGGETVHLRFPDHYTFKRSDVEKIREKYDLLYGTDKVILTTEKDYVRLLPFRDVLKEWNLNIGYYPIEVTFEGKEKEEFEDKLWKYVKQYSGNY
jgi:tetraacyldisaccharide 4'-kinase